MEKDTILQLLDAFDAQSQRQIVNSSLSVEKKHKLLEMAGILRDRFEQKVRQVMLRDEAEDDGERMNILQSDVIALESELTNLAGELLNYRQCAQTQLESYEGVIDVKGCVEHLIESRSRSSFRKGLENGIAHDVEEIVSLLESRVIEETGNEVRRTQRTMKVIQEDHMRELSKNEKILAS
ncbi:hypothetical protein WA588_002905, partial [Blastocystis sp. NMH]